MNNYKKTCEFLKEKIHINKTKEKDVVNSSFESKTEKLYDSVYFIGRFRDIKISKYNQKIENLHDSYSNGIEKLKFEFVTKKITNENYVENLNKLESNYKTTTAEKIDQINLKKEIYEKKIKDIISSKQLKNKEKIAILKQKNIDINNKIDKRFDNLTNKVISLNEEKFNIIDVKNEKKLNSKIENFKATKILSELEKNKDNKILTDEEILNHKRKLDEKIINYREKVISTNVSFDLTKYKMQIRAANMFGYQTKNNVKNSALNLLSKSKLVLIILIFCIIVGIQNPLFFANRTWINIISQNIDLGCMALGMTIIILTGGIDLSIGSTMAIGGAVIAKFALAGTNMWVSILTVTIVSMFIGMISGFFVGYVKLQPFIITLVLMIGLRGLAYIYLDNKTLIVSDDSLNILISKKIFNLPIAAFVFFGLTIISWVIMKFYKYGRYIYAVGGNKNAARLSGIKVKAVIMSAYIFSGFCVAIGTILYMARTNTITPTTGNQWELNAICAVALGGTALTGGKGGILQTIIGWFVLSILTTALVMIGINPNAQLVIKAAVILLAVLSDKKFNLFEKSINYIKQIKYSI